MTYVIYLALTAVVSVIIAFSSFFMKKASRSKSAVDYLRSGSYWLSMLLLTLSMLLQLYLHRHLEYSVMIPLLSLQSVWTVFISRFMLKEKINAKTVAGIALILAGAILTAISS